MSLTSFIFNVPITKMIGVVSFDAFVNETHTSSSKSVDYPLEDGSSISDHIVVDPQTLRVTAFKSSLGISLLDPRQPNEHIVAFEDLWNIVKNKQLVTVVSGLKVYTNMQITNISTSREARNGNSLTFDVDLKELRYVNTVSVSIPNSVIAAGKFSTTNLNKSAKNAKNAGKTTSGQNIGADRASRAFLRGNADARNLTRF